MRRVNVFYSHVAVGLASIVLYVWSATQYVAYKLEYQTQLGRYAFKLGEHQVYEPWNFFVWSFHFEPYAPEVFNTGYYIIFGGWAISMIILVFMAMVRAKRDPGGNTYGASRWKTDKELESSGLKVQNGVVLVQSADAKFDVKLGDNETVILDQKKEGKFLLRHNGPEHILAFAPTRSGKGVGFVIPTLLAWTGSVIAYDNKGENWIKTSGFRKRFSHCLKFEPTSSTSVHFNPLFEVRKGDREVGDAQNISEMLVNSNGDPDRNSESHWDSTSFECYVAGILHVLYAKDEDEKDKSITGVLNLYTNPDRDIYDTLEYMLNYSHMPDGTTHPVVARIARSCLNKEEKELSGVVSTATTKLKLFYDPVVSRNTANSDFSISDLMNAEHPVSLYIVVSNADRDRLRPLVRLILTLITRRISESMEGEAGSYKHRLLMMLDEFPTLKKLSFFEEQLAFLAGYGVKCFVVAQSLNQIISIYGQNHTFLDNCHIRLTYGALDDVTAKKISDLLGPTTHKRKLMNFAGNRLAPWLGNVMESEQETARNLMTIDEVMQMPADDAIVLIGNSYPYKAKKITYYNDSRIKDRASLPYPKTREEIAAQCIGLGEKSTWGGVGPRNDDLSFDQSEVENNSNNEKTTSNEESNTDIQVDDILNSVEVNEEPKPDIPTSLHDEVVKPDESTTDEVEAETENTSEASTEAFDLDSLLDSVETGSQEGEDNIEDVEEEQVADDENSENENADTEFSEVWEKFACEQQGEDKKSSTSSMSSTMGKTDGKEGPLNQIDLPELNVSETSSLEEQANEDNQDLETSKEQVRQQQRRVRRVRSIEQGRGAGDLPL